MSAQDALDSPRAGALVLVAEDDRAFGLFARYILTKAGCVVDLAEDGADAMALLADPARGYEAVLVDPDLADASGRTVAEAAYAMRPDAAFVLVSEGPERGSSHDVWLRKPYQPGALVRAMSAANSVSLIRRLYESRRS